ncbi:MAG: hypothetical protein H6865_06225 [Rhodospirillales bacterium]|nr:hypothetical protein [Alphaproteobacteria bacterium]MCB9987218.1 hypothetical protein [Rhodospirillales bacterium]USO07920.1 MAG: hypothetical protein H6866_01475 [Rhodospirillales bacterium]
MAGGLKGISGNSGVFAALSRSRDDADAWFPDGGAGFDSYLVDFVRHRNDDLPPLRVAVFGSFYRGLNLLQALASLPPGKVEIVGVATDDPDLPHAGGKARIWRYDEAYAQKSLVPDYTASIGIAPYFGKVKSAEFYDLYENVWKPDIAVMGTFGQLINRRLIDTPSFNFYNFHPIGHPGAWKDGIYAGPRPFEIMLERGDRQAKMIMHEVSEEFDAGVWAYESRAAIIPSGATPVSLHALTSPLVKDLVRLLILSVRAHGLLERDFAGTALALPFEHRRHCPRLVFSHGF